MKSRVKMTVRCLRCGQRHTNAVDWYVKEKHRNCPACGGEMDFGPAFKEWMDHRMIKIQKMLTDIEEKKHG
jgi:rRNA maturation endonuclease Nob1